MTVARLPTDERLQYEHYQVVSLVQALWGSISPNMIAISLHCHGEALNLHFYLQSDSVQDREEIFDIETDLEVLQLARNVPIQSYVHIVGKHIDISQIQSRLVYLRSVTSAA